MASSSPEKLPEIPIFLHQPTAFRFPKRSFSKKIVSSRSFQASWLHQWAYLHYDETSDVVHCHVHKECTDHLDLVTTATKLIEDLRHGLRIYGKFE